jgi:hypothetical protein
LQRYALAKGTLKTLPPHAEFLLMDTFEALRPKMSICQNLEEADQLVLACHQGDVVLEDIDWGVAVVVEEEEEEVEEEEVEEEEEEEEQDEDEEEEEAAEDKEEEEDQLGELGEIGDEELNSEEEDSDEEDDEDEEEDSQDEDSQEGEEFDSEEEETDSEEEESSEEESSDDDAYSREINWTEEDRAFDRTFGKLMQDTHAAVTTSRDHRSANDGNRLARALGSARVQQQAASGAIGGGAAAAAASSNMPSWMSGGGGGTTIRLLQKNSKGKASVRALVVPEDARFAQVSDTNEDTAKEEAELGRWCTWCILCLLCLARGD